jgi:hypothetical protein
MDDVPFLIFLEIAVDFWLEDHFAEAPRDPEPPNIPLMTFKWEI